MKLLGNILAAPAAVVGAVALVLTAVVLTTPKDEAPAPSGPEHQAQSEQAAPPASEPEPSTTPKPAAASVNAESPSLEAGAAASGAGLDKARKASAPDEPAKGPSAPDPVTRTYVVKPGDTPAAIAQQQLGDATLWPEITRLNPGLEARSLQIGQILNLPGGAAPAAPSVRPATMTAKPVSAPRAQEVSGAALATHRVAQGDSLYELARKYYGDGSRWTLIRDANPELQGGGVQGLRLDSELVIPALPGPGR